LLPVTRITPMITKTGLSVLALTAALAAVSAPAASAAPTTITASRALVPAFNAAIPDYTTRCVSGSAKSATVKFTATPASGTTVKFLKAAAKSGPQTISLAMKPGQRIDFTTKTGSTSRNYSVRCLPVNFPEWTATGTLPSASPFMGIAQIGPYPRTYAIVTDARGVPVWWKGTAGVTADVKPAGNGQIGFWSGNPLESKIGGAGHFGIYRADGTKVRDLTSTTNVTDLHESTLNSNGTTAYVETFKKRLHVDLTSVGGGADVPVFDAFIQEVSRTDGKVLWTWNSKDHIALAETDRWWPFIFHPELIIGQPSVTKDILHINSIQDDGKGGLIVSFRHLDAVYRIIKSTGQIDWKLGGTATDKSLTVLGDSSVAKHLGGQHDARLLPDGTLSIPDNGTQLGRGPRVTRWQIDSSARTATLVEQFSDSGVGSSPCCGSARKFADGSWLVAWGGLPNIRSYKADKTVGFDFKFGGGAWTYRANPFSASQITRAQLVAGMDKMNPR